MASKMHASLIMSLDDERDMYLTQHTDATLIISKDDVTIHLNKAEIVRLLGIIKPMHQV